MDKIKKIEMIGRRIARELGNGDFINLGIGIPTEVANQIPEGIKVTIQTENGLLGLGPAPEKGKEHKDLINASGSYITEQPGCSYFDTATSFAIIRGGHLDMTVLGALEVDQEGSIANWMVPGKLSPGIGGAMDLLTGAKSVVAALFHTDKDGNSKILKKCRLPLTGYKKISIIVTDMAFMVVTPQGLLLKEIACWTTLEEVKRVTEADLLIPDTPGCFY